MIMAPHGKSNLMHTVALSGFPVSLQIIVLNAVLHVYNDYYSQ